MLFSAGSVTNPPPGPCDETFNGVNTQPEPETKAISSIMCKIAHRLFAMVTVHTKLSLVLFPWGCSGRRGDTNCVDAPDYANMVSFQQNHTYGVNYMSSVILPQLQKWVNFNVYLYL